MIKRIIRDNAVVNYLIRNLLRFAIYLFPSLQRLTNQYRVFGRLNIIIQEVEFKFFTAGDDFIVNDIYYKKTYESAEFRLLKSLLPNSNVFVDVGANTGIFSIYAATLNLKLQVYSFEPHPGNFLRLSKNIQINSLKNVHLNQCAVGDQVVDVPFTVPADLRIAATSSINGDFTRNFHEIEYKTITVKQQTLDQILSHIPFTSADVIKIDVEYYKMNVLRGVSKIIEQYKPIILIEILQYDALVSQFDAMRDKINPQHANEIFKYLRDRNYYAYQLNESELSEIHSLENVNSRNFLFTANKL